MCYSKEPNLTVLKEFVKLHEFAGMTLVEALRYVYACASVYKYLNLSFVDTFCGAFDFLVRHKRLTE